ncbi:MAG: hypothetical protein HOV79_30500 [Hamadaea sp.]|nr:hypothetical protein [Hamadaea sp.]
MLQLLLGGLIVARVVRLVVLMSRGVTDSRMALAGLIVQLVGVLCYVPFVVLLSGVLVLPARTLWLSLVPGLVLTAIGAILWRIGRRNEREPVMPGLTPAQQRAVDDDMWGWEPDAEHLHKPHTPPKTEADPA